MDERGDVCVAGKKSRHIFIEQGGIPVMASKRGNYKAVMERETIAACLLKYLIPEAPVNAYERESFVLWYWGEETIDILEATEGLSSVVGATLYCVECYIS